MLICKQTIHRSVCLCACVCVCLHACVYVCVCGVTLCVPRHFTPETESRAIQHRANEKEYFFLNCCSTHTHRHTQTHTDTYTHATNYFLCHDWRPFKSTLYTNGTNWDKYGSWSISDTHKHTRTHTHTLAHTQSVYTHTHTYTQA